MPRKQRFKPSRKPKVVTPNEDAVMGRPVNSATTRDDSESLREPPPSREDSSPTERESEGVSS